MKYRITETALRDLITEAVRTALFEGDVIKKQYDIFGNDVTDEANRQLKKEIRRKKRNARSAERRAAKKEKDDALVKELRNLSNIVDYDKDLFGNVHTEEDRAAASRRMDDIMSKNKGAERKFRKKMKDPAK